MDNDSDYSLQEKEAVKQTLHEVYGALKQRGYDPISQISGYLISNDLGYISDYKKARVKIGKLDRNTVVEILLKEYLKCDI